MAALAPHVALQLVDRRRLRSPHNIERDGLVGVAAKAFYFEVSVPGVEGISESWRWLSWPLESKHPLVPGFTGKPVGHLARLRRPLGRCPD